MDVGALLLQVKNGQITIDEAERLLKDLPYEELGYAKLDHHRKLRSGFGETVFCQGKPDAYLAEIFRKLWERDGEVLGTRATPEQYELVHRILPEVVYDPISRILKAEKKEKQKQRPKRIWKPVNRIQYRQLGRTYKQRIYTAFPESRNN